MSEVESLPMAPVMDFLAQGWDSMHDREAPGILAALSYPPFTLIPEWAGQQQGSS